MLSYRLVYFTVSELFSASMAADNHEQYWMGWLERYVNGIVSQCRSLKHFHRALVRSTNYFAHHYSILDTHSFIRRVNSSASRSGIYDNYLVSRFGRVLWIYGLSGLYGIVSHEKYKKTGTRATMLWWYIKHEYVYLWIIFCHR